MYKNLEQVAYDLKKLDLERKIALEEIKGLKDDVKEDISPYNWLSTVFAIMKKFGILYLVKKIIR